MSKKTILYVVILLQCSCNIPYNLKWKVLDDSSGSVYFLREKVSDYRDINVEDYMLSKVYLDSIINKMDTSDIKTLFHTKQNTTILLNGEVDVYYADTMVRIVSLMVCEGEFELHNAHEIFYSSEYGVLIKISPGVGAPSYYKLKSIRKGLCEKFRDVEFEELTRAIFENRELFSEGKYDW